VAVLQHGRLIALGTPADLAHQYGQRLRMEVEVAPDALPAALNILQAALGQEVISHENGTITMTGTPREAIPGLVASLVTAGVRLYRVAPQEPSLEDVYFALTGETVEGT
jgi:ABC-type multidrug transport system ATPase subunit